jgi:hypothetical protein
MPEKLIVSEPEIATAGFANDVKAVRPLSCSPAVGGRGGEK